MIAGLTILILIPIWYFVFLPLVTALPTSFSQTAKLSHTEDNRFTIGGQWSGQTISTGEVLETVTKNEYRQAFISSKFDVQSLVGEPLFSLNQSFTVDRITMKNYPSAVDPAGETYFYFPKRLSRSPIRWWPGTFGEPLDLIFIDIETIKGLRVYHFRGERADINDTAGYEFLPMVPQKYYVLSRANLDVFVEPSSGTVVDYRDEGVSYYAGLDKRRVWDLAKWSNKFTDLTIDERIEKAKESQRSLFLLEVITPLLLLLVSLLLVNIGISGKKHLRKNKK